MANAPVREGTSDLTLRTRVPVLAALAIAAVAVGILGARSWRIDYAYSIDYATYWLAGARVNEGRAAELYDAGGGPEDGTPAPMAAGEFKNLPVLAAAFAPLARLPYLESKRAFWWISLAALVGGAALAGVVLLPPAFGPPAARAAVGVALASLPAPAHAALRHGQTTPLVMAAIALWAAARRSGRPVLSGGALAAACLVKFPPLALLALDAARFRLRAVATTLAAIAGVVLASVVAFGPALHRAYLAGVASNAGTVITGHNNQSIVAIVARLALPSPPNDWRPRPLPALVGLAATIAILVLAAAAARALLGGARNRSKADALLEIPAALALGTVALPVAWDHYEVLLAPALVALLGGLHAKGLLARRGYRLAFGIAYVILVVPTPQAILDDPSPLGPIGALAVSADGIAVVALFLTALLAMRHPDRSEA